MTTSSFDARIFNGQLVPAEPLRAFEGREVHIVVSVAPTTGTNGEPEPPDDMDIEKDVYVRIPLASQLMSDAVVVAGPISSRR